MTLGGCSDSCLPEEGWCRAAAAARTTKWKESGLRKIATLPHIMALRIHSEPALTKSMEMLIMVEVYAQ